MNNLIWIENAGIFKNSFYEGAVFESGLIWGKLGLILDRYTRSCGGFSVSLLEVLLCSGEIVMINDHTLSYKWIT